MVYLGKTITLELVCENTGNEGFKQQILATEEDS